MTVELVARMLAGNRVALSKLMTAVESRAPERPAILAAVYPRTGRAHVIGITGPPGAGKSTLTDQVIDRFRRAGRKVGVVAVDPSSPFSGGAVLGDRVRMMRHAADDGVFIRSLSTRGSHGGLSRATKEIAHLLDAFGMDVVLIETVGVGQTELDVMEVAHTTVVVLVPESGDTIQTMKAGITEIADVFVVNKSDREGAERIRRELEAMVELGPRGAGAWRIPTLATVAAEGKGVDELVERIDAHRAWRDARPKDPDAAWAAAAHDIRDLIVERFGACLRGQVDAGLLDRYRDALLAGTTDPYTVALEVLASEDLVARILLCK
jgi:LAO/AO transport system kinase